MATKQYDDRIRNHIEKKDLVKIERTFTEGESNISGFILQSSKDFLLIQCEEEFYLNGYVIIRKDQFDNIRCNKFDRTLKKILSAERIIESDYGIDKKIKLNSWETIFEDLKKYDYHVIVECENLDEPAFIIGPIKKINKSSVHIQYYDPSGVLERTSTNVDYKDVTIVKFNNRYVNIFRKYLKTQ